MSDSDPRNERLSILNIELEQAFGTAIDLNADIINATRKMAHNLIIIRNGHLSQAEALLTIIQGLAEQASITSDLTADLVVSEWGIDVVPSLDEEEYEDEEEEDE